jgi:serine/threonine protein kinase
MAPELFDGKSSPSKATDIYALGMVIYEVCHTASSGEPILRDYSRRFSPISNHSPVVPAYLRWLESVPRDHKTGRSLAFLRASGC